MSDLLARPWPWYVGGPLIGLVAVALLLHGGRPLGISATYRTACAIVAPGDVAFFRIDWRRSGAWNLAFVLGVAIGGFLAAHVLGAAGQPAVISAATRADLAALGVRHFTGLLPRELFSWHAMSTTRALVGVAAGGWLVGFGSSYAGGCTSGHGILGLADLQLPSFVAAAGFFAGGAIGSHLLLPLLLGGAP